KVEAFNEKSEKAKLTGIPDQNPGKVINLRLKPDKKKGLFGNAEGGLASQNRYSIKTNVNYFKGEMYLSGVAGSSNGGNLQGDGGTLNNKTNDLSLNYRNTFNEKLQVTTSYRGSGNNSRNRAYNQRQTFLQDSSLLQDRETVSSGKSQNHAMNASLQYAIDSYNSVSSYAAFNISDGENSNRDITASGIIKTNNHRNVNDAFTDNNRSGTNWNREFSLSYNHRFKKQGRYVGVGLSKGNSQSKGRSTLGSLTRFYNENGFMTDSLARDQLSFQNGDGQNYGFNITYTEPLAKGQILDFSYRFSNSKSKSKQETYNYNGVTGKYDVSDSTTSNNFESNNSNQLIAIGYNYFREKIQWQAGMAVSLNTQLNKDITGRQMDLKQSVINIFPRVSLIYSINKQKNLQVNYNGRNRPPSIQELQPLPDYSIPLLIRLGNPGLKQEFNNEINVNYKDFSARKNRSLFGQLQFSNTAHKIVNATRINGQGAQEQQALNLGGNYSIGTNIDYSRSFGKGRNKANIRFSTNAQYENAVNLVNAEKNVRKTIMWGQAMQLGYNATEKLEATVSARFYRSWSGYSVDAGNTTSLSSHNYAAYILYELPWQCIVSSGIRFIINEAQQHLPGAQTAVWNATVTKRLFKNQAGEIKLSAFDILNNSNNFTQVNGDNYIETTESEVLKRVFAFSFKYNFRIKL
ncbi:MAG TPA: outer membrane beta-barrel protein, partial [Niastella sp.]